MNHEDSSDASPVRVLVADDHPLFREGVRTMLAATPDLDLVAEASDGAQALELLARHQVDVALLDVNMPALSGIEAAGAIAVDFPHVAVLMLTMFADDASVFAALRAGARGYVLKDAERDDLLRAIRAVAQGEAIFSPTVASRVLDFFAQRHPSVAREEFPMLSARERDVLHLIAQGKSNPAIAGELSISERTVTTHLSRLYTKLDVSSRTEAMAEALRRGLVPAGDHT